MEDRLTMLLFHCAQNNTFIKKITVLLNRYSSYGVGVVYGSMVLFLLGIKISGC